MIPAAARAAERLFGGALQPAAGAFRAVALAALVLCVAWAAVRAGKSIAERRGEPPPELPRRRLLDSIAIVQALLAVLAVLAAEAFRIADASTAPIAALSGCAGFVFVAASLSLAGAAASPGAAGAAPRIVSGTLGVLALPPAAVLLFFARTTDPPKPELIGSLWRTPSALYVSAGGRARREGPPPVSLRVDLVEARSSLFGLVRQDLAGFAAGGREIPWRGEGGRGARLVSVWPDSLSGVLFSVARPRRDLPLRSNERVWIWNGPDGIQFTDASSIESPPDARRDATR